MILQALHEYYTKLLERGEISPPGWGVSNVTFALELYSDGSVKALHSLKVEKQLGKKTALVPRSMTVPTPVKRSVGIEANFLCDNSGYILGVDAKGKPERSFSCFEACKALHLKVLQSVDSPAANAVKAYFSNWEPAKAKEQAELSGDWDELISGGNITFICDGVFATEDPKIREAWQEYYNGKCDGPVMQCLVTGKEAHIPNIHPAIKGVRGAQSAGAALVSFNAPALESFGHTQNYNAPVGEYAAFTYTTALNHLIADREHCMQLGDTTVVCWAGDGSGAYQDAGLAMMGNSSEDQDQSAVRSCLERLSNGLPAVWEGQELDPEMDFYVLGIAPNAARLSVRFFLKSTFGSMAKHVNEHHERLKIVRPAYDKRELLSPEALLDETVNHHSRDKKPAPQLAGGLMRAILTGAPYPATLLNGVMLRIRAEHDVTRGKAAIIKAYYMLNKNKGCPEEVLKEKMVETNTSQAYTLGRLFATLEAIQQNANPGINTTIKDKYFNSASATPAAVFPLLVNLAQKHLRKLEAGQRVYWNKQLGELFSGLEEAYPQRMTLPEQGSFQLGYYHQTQYRYTKKEDK